MLTTISLSPTQIQSMNGAAIKIMEAPGVGKFLKINSVTQVLNYTNTAFANGGAITYRYISGSANVLGTGTFAATTLTGTADAVFVREQSSSSSTAAIPCTANTGIEVTNATGAFTGGTGSEVLVIVDFDVVNVGQ